jgi:hypothetical protein
VSPCSRNSGSFGSAIIEENPCCTSKLRELPHTTSFCRLTSQAEYSFLLICMALTLCFSWSKVIRESANTKRAPEDVTQNALRKLRLTETSLLRRVDFHNQLLKNPVFVPVSENVDRSGGAKRTLSSFSEAGIRFLTASPFS